MADMTKEAFICETAADIGLRYVRKQKDELCKNRSKNTKENVDGYMPEIRGSPLCPVLKYIYKIQS